eukprot:3700715-Pyramimonas_sp.AAC.1
MSRISSARLGVGNDNVGAMMHFMVCDLSPARTSAAMKCGTCREMPRRRAMVMPRSSSHAPAWLRWIRLSSSLIAVAKGSTTGA